MILCLVDLCMDEPTTVCVVDTGASKVLASLSLVDCPLGGIAVRIAALCREHKPAELWVSSIAVLGVAMQLREMFWNAGVPKVSEGGPVFVGMR